MKNKKSIKTAMLIVLAIGLVGGALAYFSAIAKTKNNVFDVFTGQKNEDGGIEIVEPSWKEPTRDSRAVAPGSYLPKDPSVLSNVAYDGWAVMRVRIPKVTSTTETQEAEQLNEIADICYFGANQVAVGSDNPLKIGDIVTFTDGLKGTKTGDLETGTFNSDNFTFLGKLTSKEGYNDYYFGYNKVLTGGSRTENLFDYIQVKPFKVLTDGTKDKIDSYVDIDAQMVQSVNEDTGAAYTGVVDAWEKVFKKPATSEEFGAVDDGNSSTSAGTDQSAGVYDNGILTKSWKTLKDENIITVDNGILNKSANIEALGDELIVGDEVTDIGNSAFEETNIQSVTLPDSIETIGKRSFAKCSELEDFNYNGTSEEWGNITKGEEWNAESPFTEVSCNDKDIIIKHTIIYDGNGAAETTQYKQEKNENPATITDNKYTKEGYVFTGWNTKEDGTGDSYAPGDSYTENENIILYAQWNKSLIANSLKFSSDGDFTLSAPKKWNGTLEYSTNNGNTWTEWDGSELSGTAEQPVYLRGTSNSKITGGYSPWTFTGKYCEGNIENLLDYQTVANGEHPVMATCCYQSMFSDCTSLITAPTLPATTLANSCYYAMFSNCTSLTTVPALSATTLAHSCCEYMFSSCTSLTTAPALPATTLAERCYNKMFSGCTSLTTAPALPATTLAERCYSNMFDRCTSLTTAPELPATTLAESCYSNMFSGCTSLTTVQALSATTLAQNCCEYMFSGCTSLTTTPALPATKLAYQCYQYMFQNCTSLTTAPVLPATTLADYCYNGMFSGCTSLTTAPALPATTLAEDCYDSMFYGCTSLTTAPALPATKLVSFCYYGMFQDCTSLKISASQGGEYQHAYRIPMTGTGTTASGALNSMLSGTGGTFTGKPTINTTYYTTNPPVNIVDTIHSSDENIVPKYKITYNLNGGSATNKTEYDIKTNTFTLTNPTKNGFEFIGWTGTGLTEKTKTVSIVKGSTGDRHYIANWKELPVPTGTLSLTGEPSNITKVRIYEPDNITYKEYIRSSSLYTNMPVYSNGDIVFYHASCDAWHYTNLSGKEIDLGKGATCKITVPSDASGAASIGCSSNIYDGIHYNYASGWIADAKCYPTTDADVKLSITITNGNCLGKIRVYESDNTTYHDYYNLSTNDSYSDMTVYPGGKIIFYSSISYWEYTDISDYHHENKELGGNLSNACHFIVPSNASGSATLHYRSNITGDSLDYFDSYGWVKDAACYPILGE